MDLSHGLMINQFLLIRYFDYLSKDIKKTGFLPHCLVKYWTGVNIFNNGKLSRVPLDNLGSCTYVDAVTWSLSPGPRGAI